MTNKKQKLAINPIKLFRVCFLAIFIFQLDPSWNRDSIALFIIFSCHLFVAYVFFIRVAACISKDIKSGKLVENGITLKSWIN